MSAQKRKKPAQAKQDRQLTPAQLLADAQARFQRLKAEKAPKDVLARYEREVQRLREIVHGVRPITSAMDTSFDWVIDPFTWQTLNAHFANFAKRKPGEAAVVPVVLPPRIRLVVGSAGRPAFLVHASLVEELARVLLSPPGPKENRDALRHGLKELVKNTPRERDDTGDQWVRTKRRLVRETVTNVLVDAVRSWRGRVSSGHGAGTVEGKPVLTTAVAIGLEQWVKQETLKRARESLLTYTSELLAHLEREVQTKTGDIEDAEKHARAPDAESALEAEVEFTDELIVRTAKLLPRLRAAERRVMIAKWGSEYAPLFEEAAKRARAPVTAEERPFLYADYHSSEEIEQATGLKHVDQLFASYKKKDAKLRE